ncbi:MAG TPA: LLM class flavin-dependent oxidoreductase [Ktedonobacterales bacterium]|nr:LLM class flavin-dependent oxidoreductase [Ktedonobacterales bacterium]
MKLGLMLPIGETELAGNTPRFTDLADMARSAEQIGLDSVWVADHLISRMAGKDEEGVWECFTLLGALAAVTSRVTLGPLVACTSFRNPALLAKMADTLDDISGGRFVLGLGAGWHEPEYAAFGYPFDHLATRFEESLEIIVPLLRKGSVSYSGQYVSTGDAVLRPRGPSKGAMPILIGARRPRMLSLIARYADAYNTVWHMDPAVVTQRWDEMKAACRAIDRDPATLELTAGTIVRLLGPDTPADPESKYIQGEPEEVAQRLRGFAEVGVQHLIVVLDPISHPVVERFARVAELLKS